MDLELGNAVVLVTGGSKGIGLACARRLAAEGARVAIASRSADNLARAVAGAADEGLTLHGCVADLGDPAQAGRLRDEVESVLGPVDVLVNSAGAARRENPRALTAQLWRDAMEAKFFPYIHAMDALLPGMVARGHGCIVNVIGAGGKRVTPTHLTGGAANAALMLATAGLANAFAADGVRVNAVNPALVETDRMTRTLSTQGELEGITIEEARRRLEGQAPMGRLARPEEVADVVAFLASARSGYVNGAILTVDGAQSATVL
jgi:NAD(P)-dependent dehydrogenase (short-subunit alcohol dehydrogenase family)